MVKKIVIIEDEEDIAELMRYNLTREGFEVAVCGNGDEGLKLIRRVRPDVILLDLMLPGLDGRELTRRIRSDRTLAVIPIIMVTAKTDEADIVIGLELGADDYVTKPFSPKVLISRVKAVLRRAQGKATEGCLSVGGLVIDSSKYKVMCDGADIALTRTEFTLLTFMAQRPGIVLTREQLLNGVFGYASASYDRTIDTHIKSLRKKLGEHKTVIETVRGVGYRCAERV